MLKPPTFSKKSEQTTFTAELFTTVNRTKEFFLPLGVSHCDPQSRNDSFSFNKKNTDIFNPLENFSCVKKETPKFGRTENQISTPSENMMQKYAEIKNQIRLEQALNKVLHFNKETPNGMLPNKLFPGEKAREFQNRRLKRARRVCSSKKMSSKRNIENEPQSSNSSFLSKGKRVLSSKGKRSKKGPKILGKKHLEIFHSKFLNKSNKAPLNCFIIYGNKQKSKIDSLKYQKRTHQKKANEGFTKNKSSKVQNATPNPDWSELFPMLSDPKMIPKNHQVKAKHLTKNFQKEFRKRILNPYRTIANNSTFKSPCKKNKSISKTPILESHHKNYNKSLKRNRKLNLRYQSARKCNFSNKNDQNLGLTHRNLNQGALENQFLMRELRFMMDKSKGRSVSKKNPIIPILDFRL